MKSRKKLIVIGAALMALLCTVAVVDAVAHRVAKGTEPPLETRRALASTATAPTVAAPAKIAPVAPAAAVPLSPRGTKTVRIVADQTMTAPLRRTLEQLGARVIAPVGPRAVLAEVTPAVSKSIAKDIRFTTEDVLPAAKIASVLSEQCAKSPQERVRVNILGLSAADRDALVSFVTAEGGTVRVCPLGPEALTAEVSPALVASLAARGDVRWIEPALERQLLNDQTVVTEGANIDTLRTVHHLRGRGQRVTVCDTGLDTGLSDDVHWDFFGRVREIVHVGQAEAENYGYKPTLADYNGHGTHVAGTVLGDGARSDGLYKGMAQVSELYFQACSDTKGKGVWMDSYEGLLTKSLANKSYIHSNSWGSKNSWGRYDAICTAYDTVLWSHPEILVVVAAGNDGERGEGSVCSHPACSKNVLTVGNTMSSRPTEDWLLVANPTNLNPSSGRGPTCDGRIKPEIAAPGTAVYSTLSTKSLTCTAIAGNAYYTEMTGTSMSTPLVSGAAALVREWLVDRRDFTNALPTAALMKAILAGGGVVMTGVGAELTDDRWKKFSLPQVLPNTDYGWGRVNLEETLYPTNGRSVKFVDRIPFGNGVTNIFDIVTTNAAPLDIQLCWIDYPSDASTDEDQTLINDLDLIVSNKTTGAVWLGNGVEGGDHLNTMESVRIPLAEKGDYAVLVAGHSVSYEDGGAAALYVRGAFADETKPTPDYVLNLRTGKNYDCLDEAIREVVSGDTLKVCRSALLAASVTVPADCTVVADPCGVPVSCVKGAVVTVPAGVTFGLKGLVFTNFCSGVEVAGRLEASAGTSFESLDRLTVAAGGQAALSNVVFSGTSPDLTVSGQLTLGATSLCEAQTVTVEASGNLTIQSGVTNLTQITLATSSTSCLTLAGSVTDRIEVFAPNACTNGAPFGAVACDPAVAAASAPYFVNMLDEEGELGGQTENGILRWAIVEAPPEAAGSTVDIPQGRTYYYYAFKTALRMATNFVSATVSVIDDSSLTCAMTIPNALTIASTGGSTLVFSNAAQLVVQEGARLVLTNITVSGAGEKLTDCAFKVAGGELVLENGAELSDLCDTYSGKSYGGAVVVNPGRFTMRSGSRIRKCEAHAGGAGGAVWVCGSLGPAVADLLGGTITRCAATSGGAVHASGGATVNVQGDFRAVDNVKRGTEKPSNLYLTPNSTLTLTGELTGPVGVSFGKATPDRNAQGVSFIAIGEGLDELAKTKSSTYFSNDLSSQLEGGCEAGAIVWKERPPYDGTCDIDPSKATVWTYRKGSSVLKHYYEDLNLAITYVSWDAPLYILKDVTLTGGVEIVRKLVLARDAELSVNPKVYRKNDAVCRIATDGALTVSNVTVFGVASAELAALTSGSSNTLFAVDGGSLTLGDGALVGLVRGHGWRAANAISVYGGGTLTMESGSVVSNSCNRHVDVTEELSCGGGILLDGSTAYFRGGRVELCSAYRAGAVYVANGSKAYVSGDFTAANSTELTGLVNDNFVVSKNSELILAGPFTGSVGVNEGIACDTNCFGQVDTNWDWDYDTLTNSAAHFIHDKRAAFGRAVTNGVDKTAYLVWSDWLSKAGRFVDSTGAVYRVCLAPGQSLAVPKAFSVAPTAGENGQMTLSLEGAVEGCWYTIYSTADLAKPFTEEASVQLKKGETFEFKIDQTKDSKFYKVVAEEGLH